MPARFATLGTKEKESVGEQRSNSMVGSSAAEKVDRVGVGRRLGPSKVKY
jgi:hypothetical protein